MIRAGLLTLALGVTLGTGVDAQTGDLASAGSAETSAPLRGQSGLGPNSPAAVVAMRVRSVLNDQANPDAWRELSGALPELAIAGDADLESTFNAARIAGEIGRGRLSVAESSAFEATTTAPDAGRVVPGADVAADFLADLGHDVAGLVAEVGTSDVELIAEALAGLLVVYVLVRLLFGGTRERTASSRKGGGSTTGRHREARSLYADGMPVHEIARRTGLARDAVAVIVSRGGR